MADPHPVAKILEVVTTIFLAICAFALVAVIVYKLIEMVVNL